MPDDASPPPPSLLRSSLLAVLVLALPALIILGTRAVYHRVSTPPDDTPTVRKLRSIGAALHRYAEAHGGRYPATLDDLARDQHLPADLPAIPGFADEFQYLGGQLGQEQSAPNGAVLVCEPIAVNGGRGSHVLYADGSDAWVPADHLKDELDRSRPERPPE